MKKTAIFWSGGKDSALALSKLMDDTEHEVKYLITTIHQSTGRVSMHGVRKELILQQADALGIPLVFMVLREHADSHDEYEDTFKALLKKLKEDEGIEVIAFGDIFLEDLKIYRENLMKSSGLEVVFPIWGEDTKLLLWKFSELDFSAIVCASSADFEDLTGERLNSGFINILPEGVDPCGENGEFHSFVYDGPIFKHAVKFKKGERILKHYTMGDTQKGFYFLDLLPE
ncbi:diphthine--ammonia ligase [Cytophagaceae bacterium ABcell3]|nr:diphthine--ammonia ligase [Cytophagaceae bacterium ABcell3]